MSTGSENARNTELLDAELPDHRFVDDAYLHWLYDENPHGAAFQRGADDEHGTRIAHYAIVPQEYRDRSGPTPNAFSLNAVVRTGSQRGGHFTRLGLEIYAEATAQGRSFVIGVCNEKSIGAVVKYMGWRNAGPLPVRLCPPLGLGDGVEHHRVDDAWLHSRALEELAAGLDAHPARGYTNRYTLDHLRWRLACPHTAYVVHVAPELVAVSTRDRRFGVPAAVILKLLPRDGRSGPISSREMIAAVCRHHRAPYAVYAGWNAHVPVHGIQPPRRLQPSPLYLILRTLAGDMDQNRLELDTFEFLDMDAY